MSLCNLISNVKFQDQVTAWLKVGSIKHTMCAKILSLSTHSVICAIILLVMINQSFADEVQGYKILSSQESSQIFGNGCGNSGGCSGPKDGPASEDPVDLSNGNLFFEHSELSYPSQGFDFDITRRYNAQQISELANWEVDEDGSGPWAIENGVLSGQGDILKTYKSYSKSIIEAEFITLDSGTYDVETAWINFRFTDKTKRYIVMLRKDGVLALLKHNSSAYEDVQLDSVQGAALPTDWNRIKIIDDMDSTGGDISIYLNDILMLRYTENNPLPAGRVALESRYSHAHYDTIRITDIITSQVQFDDFNDRDMDYPYGNWTASYNDHLWERANGDVVVEFGNALRYLFQPIGSTSPQLYTAPLGYFYKLTKKATNYTLEYPDHRVYTFDLTGKLTEISDRNGNRQTFTYSSISASVPPFDDGTVALWIDDFNDGNVNTNGVGLYAGDDGTLANVSIDNDALKAVWNNNTDYFYSLLEREGEQADISNYAHLEFDVKGLSGNENFKIAIRDTSGFYRQTLSSYHTTTTNFTTVTIPLSSFSTAGADLTKIKSISIEFSEQASGTVWLDNIAFTEVPASTSNVTYSVDRVTSINDTAGRTVSFTHGANGKIATLTDPKNRVWTYTYDANNWLTKVTFPNTSERHYSYYANGNLNTYTDRNGNTYSMTYLYNDKVYQQTDPQGKVTTFDYRWTTTEVFNDKGESWIYKFDFVLPDYYKLVYKLEPIHMYDRDYTGTSYNYGANGLVSEEIDANGHSTQYDYDSRGNMTKITNPMGNSQNLEYHASYNAVTKTTDEINRITRITYDSSGNPLTITDPKGNKNTFTYDAFGNMLSSANPWNVTTTYQYTANGDLARITNPLAEQTNFTYDAVGNLTQITDGLNQATSYTYDDANNVLTETDALGHATTFTYDNNNNLLTITEPSNVVTTFEYNSYNKVSKVTDAEGNTSTFDYDGDDLMFAGEVLNTKVTDGLNNVTDYIYNSLNQLVRVNEPTGYFTRFTYDYVGNLTQIINQNNEATAFIYNPLGNVWKKIFPDATEIETLYDNVGNVVSEKLQDGTTILYNYDGNDNLIKIDYPTDPDVTFIYDKINRRIRMTDQFGNTDYLYDNANRLIRETTPWAQLDYAYDDAGNRTTLKIDNTLFTTYTYDATHRLTYVQEGADTYSYVYTDKAVIPTRVDFPSLAYAHTILDNLDQIDRVVNYSPTDAVLSDFNYTRNAVNNITKEVQPAKTYTYTYDAIGQLLSRTEGTTTTDYEYDAAGNPIDPITGSVTVTETDPSNNPSFPAATGNDRSLWVRNHATDPVNLLTNANAQTDLFDFCAAPHGDSSRAITRIYLALGWHGETQFCANETDLENFIAAAHTHNIDVYYAGGASSWIVKQNGNDAFGTHFVDMVLSYNAGRTANKRFDGIVEDIEPYNMDANDEALIWPDDHVTIMERYDNTLQEIKSAINTYEAQNSTTLPFGISLWTNYSDAQLDDILPESDFVVIMNYKDRGTDLITAAANEMSKANIHNKDIVVVFNADVNGSPLETFAEEGAAFMETEINTFEAAYSTISEYNEDSIFEYKSGYIDMPIGTTYPTDPIVTVTIQGNYTYATDGRGNVTTGTSPHGDPMTLLWNEANRLEQVTITTSSGTETIDYRYDGDGKLRERNYTQGTTLVKETRYINDGWRLLEERDGTNSVERQYIWGHDYSGTFEGLGGIGGLLGMIDHTGITTEAYSYFYNGRGDIIQVIDDTGTVVADYAYNSFGFPENATGTLTQNFRFSTKFLDPESGFIYYGYRWYSPETMRWLSMDPLGEEGGINLYQFVLNNPITLYDALGLEAEGGDNEEQIVKAGALSGFLKFLKTLKRDRKKPGVKGAPKKGPGTGLGPGAKVTESKIGNVKALSSSRLKSKGINAEALKAEFVGGSGRNFNVGTDKAGNVILIPVKKGGPPPVETGLKFDDLPGIFPLGGK